MTLLTDADLLKSQTVRPTSQNANRWLSIMSVTALLLGAQYASAQTNASMQIAETQVAKATIEESRRIKPAYAADKNPSLQQRYVSYGSSSNVDRIGQLIHESEANRHANSLNIEQRKRIIPINKSRYTSNQSYNNQSYGYRDTYFIEYMDFPQWLSRSTYRENQVNDYRQFLTSYVGAANVPPMDQLLSTARSWAKCGYEPYQVPPRELWTNMVLTLRLYGALKSQGILPATTEIRSVYRSPGLNACAGGASSSKHMTNGAIDIWVPEYDNQPWYISPLQDRLCQFWATQGESYNLGLGIYATGSIHLDTQGHRMWGAQHTESYSPCRYVNQ